MIISQTPLRISFVGGGTDFKDFYSRYPGRVLSASIDKYIYLGVNSKFDGHIRISYSKTENVDDRDQIQHTIVKAALAKTGIERGIEIVSVGDIPAKGTGLGSSSSFTVGLLRALYSYLGQDVSSGDLAKEACQIEIDKLNSPIGKQDHYAAVFGGFNIINFNSNEDVKVEKINLSENIRKEFQDHLLAFFTGRERLANGILSEQKNNIDKNFEFLKEMSDMVPVFKNALEKGDFKETGAILHKSWLIKKELASKISDQEIDQMYERALESGAFGGKILGAGGGGFLLLIAPPENHIKIKNGLCRYRPVSFRFTDFGSRIVFKG